MIVLGARTEMLLVLVVLLVQKWWAKYRVVPIVEPVRAHNWVLVQCVGHTRLQRDGLPGHARTTLREQLALPHTRLLGMMLLRFPLVFRYRHQTFRQLTLGTLVYGCLHGL